MKKEYRLIQKTETGLGRAYVNTIGEYATRHEAHSALKAYKKKGNRNYQIAII